MTQVTLSNGQVYNLHCNMSVMLKREKAMHNPDVRQNKTLLSLLIILAMIQAADPDTTTKIDDLMNLDSFEDFNALDQAALAELCRMLGTTPEAVAAQTADNTDDTDSDTAQPVKD